MQADRSLYIGTGAAALAFVCVLAIAVADGWRMALLTGFACGALLGTRIRFSGYVAAFLLVIAALVILTGPDVSA